MTTFRQLSILLGAMALKPLLKWAGGKRWLLPILNDIWQPHQEKKLVEPFTGGMAVALGLNPNTAILNDANIHLINFYQQVRKGLKVEIDFKNTSVFYYQMRDKFNALIGSKKYKTKEAATIFYYLIRTGFNGLCRFNSNGEFNVPFGQHRSIKYKTDFLEYKDILKNWQITSGDFEDLDLIGNEFLYVDPPYDVEFTQYYTKGFNWEDQCRLVEWLALHKGPIIASNQATDRIIKLYKEFKFKTFVIPAPRSISCTGNRQPALEILAFKGFKLAALKPIIETLA
jgi:DNA adenine methylase